jgi:hypothetical protein
MDSEDEEERGQETYGQNRWHGDLAAVGRLDVAMGLLGLVLYYGAPALWPDGGGQFTLVV